MRYLNLGCGLRFHPEWTNIDLISSSQLVKKWDLRKGIPFPNDTFDVVYLSHLLEHFPKEMAENFLKECARVLRPQGILRVVVPDLEQITRYYLTALEKASGGSQEWAANYEWILLEMYDQVMREKSGGEMFDYLSQAYIPNKEFILKRFGGRVNDWINVLRDSRKQPQNNSLFGYRIKSLLKKILQPRSYLYYLRELMIKVILAKEYGLLKIVRFRNSGEIHLCMFDHYSLSRLLDQCGLKNIMRRSATESYIQNWKSFNLDTEPDGTEYKPDSLYMEAIKA